MLVKWLRSDFGPFCCVNARFWHVSIVSAATRYPVISSRKTVQHGNNGKKVYSARIFHGALVQRQANILGKSVRKWNCQLLHRLFLYFKFFCFCIISSEMFFFSLVSMHSFSVATSKGSTATKIAQFYFILDIFHLIKILVLKLHSQHFCEVVAIATLPHRPFYINYAF